MRKDGWCHTYKSLLLVSNILSFLVMIAHIICKVLYNEYRSIGTTAVTKMLLAILVCHWAILMFLITYVRNYNILVARNTIEKSKDKFLMGLIPFFVYELINIFVLILV